MLKNLFLVLVIILLFSTGCNRETEFIDPQNVTFLDLESDYIISDHISGLEKLDPGHDHPVRVRSSLEITEIYNQVLRSLSSVNGAMRGKDFPFGITHIDENRILEYKDSIGNLTYSFYAPVKNQNSNHFFNLVVTKDTLGNLLTPYLLKYEMEDEDPKKPKKWEDKLSKFKGTIKQYSLNGSGLQSNFSPTNEPCATISYGGGGSAGGIPTGSCLGCTVVGTGSGSTCTTTIINIGCSCENHMPGQYCTCGQGGSGTGPIQVIITNCSGNIQFDSNNSPKNDLVFNSCTPLSDAIAVNIPTCYVYGDPMNCAELGILKSLGYSEAEIDQINTIKDDIAAYFSGIIPQSDAEWEVLANTFREELIDGLPDLVVPGLGDIKNAVKQYSEGAYLQGTISVARALFDIFGGKIAGSTYRVGRFMDTGFAVFKSYKGAVKTFRSINSSNKRHNLGVLLGKTLPDHHAHHVFPEKFRAFFQNKGFLGNQIDDPKYLQWWQKNSHVQNSYQYNLEWQNWITNNSNATNAQVKAFGKTIMSKYGLTTNF